MFVYKKLSVRELLKYIFLLLIVRINHTPDSYIRLVLKDTPMHMVIIKNVELFLKSLQIYLNIEFKVFFRETLFDRPKKYPQLVFNKFFDLLL